MFKRKKIYSYTDNFGKEHKIRVSPDDIRCVPYATADTGWKPLRIQNLCKLLYWETYNGVNLRSMSIICPYNDKLIGKTFTISEINEMSISGDELQRIVDSFEEPSDIEIMSGSEYAARLAIQQAYEKGLKEAWECARKINELDNIEDALFNTFHEEQVGNVYDNYSASEAIAKIKEYEG